MSVAFVSFKNVLYFSVYCSFFFLLLVPERGERRDKERERNTDQLPPACAPAGDQTCDPGMCPDRELNQRPFGLQVTPSQLSHTGQGFSVLFFHTFC